MAGYVKKLRGYEKHHEPSYNEGAMNVLLSSKAIPTSKIDDIGAPLMGVFSYLKKKSVRKLYYIPIIFQKISYVLFLILYKIFVHLKIEGRENLKNIEGPIIFAPNHTSELDVTLISLLLPIISKHFPIYFLTNPCEKYKQAKFGWRRYIYGGLFFDIRYTRW